MSDVGQHVSESTTAIRLTPAAEQRVLMYLKDHVNRKAIRLSVKKTGCSGLSYVIDYTDEPMENDVVLPLQNDYLICIDKASYPYLKGMEMDYVKQGLNYKFIFNNPNQTGQCGCGESFTVE